MASVFDVADYFIAKTDPEIGDLMTHLKLQKMVFYAQGFCLAMYDRPLFPEAVEAWEHGPVCPALYREMKQYGSSPIPSSKTIEEAVLPFTAEERELLEDVHSALGKYSAWMLREISHQEKAWQDAYVCNGPFGSNGISREAMKESCLARLVN